MSETRMRKVALAAMGVLFAGLASLALAPPSIAADPPAAADAAVAKKADALLHAPFTQVLGNPQGDVTFIEFFDYACPNCKAMEPRLEAFLKADKGVKLVIKEFPILTPESLVATKVSLASVKQGKYAQFHQALMMHKGTLDEAAIFDTAKSVGLDVKRLRKDMASPAISDAVIQNLNLARSLRIFATPGFIVGDHIMTGPSSGFDFPAIAAAERAHQPVEKGG